MNNKYRMQLHCLSSDTVSYTHLYIDIIEKSIYNIDSKICGIIDDYRVLQEHQKVEDYVIQFLRTYLEHIAAVSYTHLRIRRLLIYI